MSKYFIGFVIGAVLAFGNAKVCFADFVLSFNPSTSSPLPGSQVAVDVFLTETASVANSRLLNLGLTSFDLDVSWSGIGSIASVTSTNNFTSSFASPSQQRIISGNTASLSANKLVGSGIFGTTIGTNLHQAKIASFTFDVGATPGIVTNLVATARNANSEWVFGDIPNDVVAGSVTSGGGSITAVPEPSSIVLLGLLSVPAVAYRRWKKARA